MVSPACPKTHMFHKKTCSCKKIAAPKDGATADEAPAATEEAEEAPKPTPAPAIPAAPTEAAKEAPKAAE